MSIQTQNILNELNSWLAILIKHQGTDLHIKSNALVRARIKGSILPLNKVPVPEHTIEGLIKSLMGDKYHTFEDIQEFDGTYSFSDEYRFRVNIYMHYAGYALNFRLIPQEIKTIEELNLPTQLHKLSKLERGLVLVTGTTGSGKSTLLASVIDEINRNSRKHIITIEDPIEYIYNDDRSIIEQREIGQHTKSFSSALRAALREDPDVIVVGEIRDLDTAESILQAVNTGHLVFSTVHTLDAKETIDRMISIFPSEEQNRVRATLATTLEAIVSQRLIKGVNNIMLPSVEMMFKSPLVQELIRSKRDNEITDVLEKEGNSFGSMTFNQSLFELTLKGKISEETACQYATSPADLKLMLSLSEAYTNKLKKKS
jgi:twitching motility protein PilT